MLPENSGRAPCHLLMFATGRADAGEQGEGSDSQGTHDSSHSDGQKAQSGLKA